MKPEPVKPPLNRTWVCPKGCTGYVTGTQVGPPRCRGCQATMTLIAVEEG